jgi:1-acyl-sn-glycerol-3-phosphate acyltransferase
MIARAAACTVMRVGFALRVTNAAAIPAHGAFVVVANHTSHLDAPALLAALPPNRAPDTHAVAAYDYFFTRPWLGALATSLVNAVAIERAHGVDALAPVGALLARGHGVIFFPEGTRSMTGELQRFRCGVGALLAGANVVAVPAWIEGASRLWPKGHRCPRPGRLAVRFGAGVSYGHARASTDGWKGVAADLERRVRALRGAA